MNSKGTRRKSFVWYEPKWSFRPKVKTELSVFLNIKMWLRVLIVVSLITVVIGYFVERAVPNLEFNWAGALAAGIGMMVMLLAMLGASLWLIPPRIAINRKGILRQQGQSNAWRLRNDMRSITVDVTDLLRPRLHVEANGKRPWDIGIASKVNVPELTAFLREIFPELLVAEK